MRTSSFDRDRGSVLPLVLVGLATVALLALAGFESARFAVSAARNQVAAAAALHAADSGLELYARGVGAAAGPLVVEAPPGRATITVVPLIRLADSSTIVVVSAEAEAPMGARHRAVRRLQQLVRIDSIGTRHPAVGSWRERL